MKLAHCPRCDRDVSTTNNRYQRHTVRYNSGDVCRMSSQHVPITGHSPTEYLARAYLVGDLAEQVQDRDPSLVFDYLTVLPPAEIQRLLMLALAAIPVDQTVEEMFAWVCDLPSVKGAA